MKKASRLTGTSWHVETLKRKEGDERRDKRRCIYYCKETRECNLRITICDSSAHCKYYKEDVVKVSAPSYLDTLPKGTKIVYDKGKGKKVESSHMNGYSTKKKKKKKRKRKKEVSIS